MTSENTTLGRRIMSLRKAAGMTQEQLAEKLGVSPQAVSKWENDISCPDISAIPLIASIFGVSADELLGMKEHTPQPKPEIIPESAPSRPKGLGPGILMIVLGTAILMSRAADLPFALWDILWPAVLLGVGIAWAIENRSVFCLGIGGIGLAFLLANLDLTVRFKPDWHSIWPLALILAGLDIVLHRLFPSVFRSKKSLPRNHRFDGKSVSKYSLQNGFISGETAFGEEHHSEEGCKISGGNLKTTFGQCTLDLSKCTFAPDAELSVEVTFGQLQLILPSSAQVISNTESAFGSTDITGTPDEGAVHVTLCGKISFASLKISYK